MTNILSSLENLKQKGFCLYILPSDKGWYCGNLDEDNESKELKGFEDGKLEMAISRMITRCIYETVPPETVK